MMVIKQSESTAARRRIPFYLVDETDGVTAETGRTLSGAEVKVTKNGAAFATGTGTVTEVGSGWYYYEAAAGEVDTIGFLGVNIYESGVRVANVVAQVTGSDPNTAPPTGADIADAVWDEPVAGHVSAGTFGANLEDSVGDVIESMTLLTTLLNQTIKAGSHVDAKTEVLTRDDDDRPLTAVRRCYDSAENATTDDGVTGLVGTLSTTTTYTAEGKVATYKATWEAA